jgi:hypothetical protein
MGYITNFSGELTITPPVPWSKIRNSKFLYENASSTSREWREVYLVVHEDCLPTHDGDLIRKHAVGIKVTMPYDAKNYNVVEHLQELLGEIGTEFTVTGHFDANGEESGDIWRLTVVKDSPGKNVATVVKPKMLWPEDLEKLTDAITKIVKEQRIKVTASVIAAMLSD